jgi:protein subunit release factor A
VSIHDCEVQHFRSGGKGGQNQNKRDTGTRVIHHPSGARGEARDERSQLQNKRLAFRRMVDSKAFRLWVAIETGRIVARQAEIQAIDIPADQVRVEVRQGGRWVEVDPGALDGC